MFGTGGNPSFAQDGAQPFVSNVRSRCSGTPPHEVPGGSWIVHATDPQGAFVRPRRTEALSGSGRARRCGDWQRRCLGDQQCRCEMTGDRSA